MYFRYAHLSSDRFPFTPNVRYRQPHAKSDQAYSTGDFKVEVWMNGTETVAHVTSPDDEIVGTGIARRRKGERRNEAAGISLALSRALAEASQHFAETADAALEGTLPE